MPAAVRRTSRRVLLAAGATVPLLGPLAACSGDRADVTGRLRIATGNLGAVFERYGGALAAELGRALPEVEAGTLTSAGSRENLDALVDGRADAAFCLGDTASERIDEVGAGNPPFLALTRLYDSFLQVVVRRDVGVGRIGELAGLAGRRVAAGQPGSGTRTTLARTLEAAGIVPRT